MKQIKTYINEKLRLSVKPQYTCQPKDTKELLKIIKDRIENEGPNCDLNDIDTSKMIDMSYLFYVDINKIFKDFNGDISMWDVSNVENMHRMFQGCEKFNCDLSRWNVSKVKHMYNMFDGCYEFDCDISKWDISNVDNIQYMFWECKKFKQNLDSWDVSNVKYMSYAFKNCPTKPKWYDRKKWEPAFQ